MKIPIINSSRRIELNVVVALGCLLWLSQSLAAEEEAALWEALRTGGHVVLMRHALAPGTGDPPEFSVSDCSTQRNISDEGRQQAKRIGDRFRANGIPSAVVYSSQWCRCMDTAELLGLGRVTELPVINSFFQDFSREEPQTKMLREWLTKQDLKKPVVLVTHQVNINALTNVYTSSGEMVILRKNKSGKLQRVGTIETE